MKNDYAFTVQLLCPICGSTDIEMNEDNTYGKCNKCNKEFPGGYDELVELNQAHIQDEIDAKKDDIQKDIEKEIADRIKKAFMGITM